jgi:hypothetical protein
MSFISSLVSVILALYAIRFSKWTEERLKRNFLKIQYMMDVQRAKNQRFFGLQNKTNKNRRFLCIQKPLVFDAPNTSCSRAPKFYEFREFRKHKKTEDLLASMGKEADSIKSTVHETRLELLESISNVHDIRDEILESVEKLEDNCT